MTRAEKAARIAGILDELHPRPDVPLEHEDPFTLLVAVLLSAQTTDRAVNAVTPALFARASTPAGMAALDVAEIQSILRTIGLAPTKAVNLKKLSEELLVRYGGVVPDVLEELETLPGVGHKTASVVVAQAFGIPAFPVDTHIHRLASRWDLSAARNVAQTEADLKRLFPRERWTTVHLQIIYFGRQYCPARWHDFEQCPICSWATSKVRRARERESWRAKKGYSAGR